MQALFVVIEQLEGHGDFVAGADLVDVGDVRLGGEGGMVRRLQVVRSQPQGRQNLVEGAVEQDVVEGHVEVAVVVDPLWLDAHRRGAKRRGNAIGIGEGVVGRRHVMPRYCAVAGKARNQQTLTLRRPRLKSHQGMISSMMKARKITTCTAP